MWSIIIKNNFFFFFIFWNTGGIFITDVRKFSKDRYWNFITVSYRMTCADSRSGYLRLLWFFLLIPVTSIVQK